MCTQEFCYHAQCNERQWILIYYVILDVRMLPIIIRCNLILSLTPSTVIYSVSGTRLVKARCLYVLSILRFVHTIDFQQMVLAAHNNVSREHVQRFFAASMHPATVTAPRASAILDSPSTLAIPAISPPQQESMVSAPKTFATSVCPIAQNSINVPSEVGTNAKMVQAEDSQAQVHLGLQKAAAANEKYKHHSNV